MLRGLSGLENHQTKEKDCVFLNRHMSVPVTVLFSWRWWWLWSIVWREQEHWVCEVEREGSWARDCGRWQCGLDHEKVMKQQSVLALAEQWHREDIWKTLFLEQNLIFAIGLFTLTTDSINLNSMSVLQIRFWILLQKSNCKLTPWSPEVCSFYPFISTV